MQQENPKISVIVPIYKVEKYLNECVDSILAQTYTNLEVILVDDGSPDSCPQICDNYAKQDARVVVHQENGGVSAARNAGLEVVTGKYIMFVDSDDYIALDMLEVLYNGMVQYDANIVYCSHFRVYGEQIAELVGNQTLKIYETGEQALKDYMLRKAESCLWGRLYQASLFEVIRFPENIHIGEDYFVVALVIESADKIVYLPQPKYYYRIQNNSAMNQGFTPKVLGVVEVSNQLCELIAKKHPNLIPYAEFSYIYACVFVYGNLVKNKKPTKENQEMLASFEQSLQSNAPKYLKNPFLTKREKMVLRLLCLNKTVCKQASRFYFYVKSRTNKVEQ